MPSLMNDRVRDALFMVALFGSVSVACAQAAAQNSDKPTRVPGRDGVEEPSDKQAPLDRVMTDDASVRVGAGPITMLPSTADIRALPSDSARAIPDIRDTEIVKLPDRVVVVRPESWTIVEAIARVA
jgi:hypothetical protein